MVVISMSLYCSPKDSVLTDDADDRDNGKSIKYDAMSVLLDCRSRDKAADEFSNKCQ